MKTTRLIISLLIAVIACSAYSYSQNSSRESDIITSNDIKFKDYNYVRNFKYCHDGDNETYYLHREIKLQYPVAIKGLNDISGLQKAIINAIGNDKIDTVDELLSYLDSYQFEDKTATIIKSIPEDISIFHKDEELNEVKFVKTHRNIVIYKFDNFIYNAGATHGMFGYTYLNYDLKDNAEIKLDEIFIQSEMPKVNRLIQAELSENKEIIANLNDNQKIYNFIINENSITFVFNPYEVACYAAGVVTAEIPLRALAPYLTIYGRKIMQ